MDRRIDIQLGRHTYRQTDVKVSTENVNVYVVTDCAAMATKHLKVSWVNPCWPAPESTVNILPTVFLKPLLVLAVLLRTGRNENATFHGLIFARTDEMCSTVDHIKHQRGQTKLGWTNIFTRGLVWPILKRPLIGEICDKVVYLNILIRHVLFPYKGTGFIGTPKH